MSLSSYDKSQFAEKGIVRLARFVSKREVDAAKTSILSELDRLKLRAGGKLATSRLEALPVFQQISILSQKVKVESALDELFSHDLAQAISSLTPLKLKPSAPHPQLLLSFPHKEQWSLMGLNWHLDMSVPKADELTGVQAFILIDTVQPRGGATLALAGSHKLHYLKAQSAQAILREDEVFSALFNSSGDSEEHLLKPRSVGGVEISVVEMSGKAGDVYLMDMRVLHSPSINATKNIRMMATNRYVAHAGAFTRP